MGYVNIRERREERGRLVTGPSDPGRAGRDLPRVPMVIALALGIPVATLAFLLGLTVIPLIGLTVILCLCAIGVALFAQGGPRVRPRNPRSERGLGAEKQLLLALREYSGLTAVEAALETSLTVDEADGILSSLAERGHLVVEGRDGALCYALPGRRPTNGFGSLG